ncbi:MAG: aminopeptidase P family N-terminal domain-containing protein, partial [Bacteroidetes bacterium]|nr:aminopeptidase P family N-terminal domain-containing protein [Bacteroidota bacterium]
MTIDVKITRVREEMENAGMDAYIIPITDPHQGEYMPERYRSITWLTGFTGSAGTVVITRDFAGLWTDSRYFIQAEQQLRNLPVSLVKLKVPHTPEYIEWITETLPGNSRVGIDGKVVSVSLVRQIKESFS